MSTYTGLRKLQSFAPNWGDPEVLERTLVGRRELVDRLEELALDGAHGGPVHQRLIVGPRGSGKTHVIRVLHNRLLANEDLKRDLVVIYLLEDELGVASFLDFVIRLLRALARWYPERTKRVRALDEIYDLPLATQESRAVQLLLDEVNGRRALILMENLGVTFDNKSGFGRPGQQALRDFLQQNPRFMIFATSQALVEGIRRRDGTFHGFFHITHLRRLSTAEAMEFLLAMADAYNNSDAVAFLSSAEGRGRMSAVIDFTGGNHRLLVTFYDFLVAASVARLSQVFMESLNPLRPYYQEQMRGLSAQQQKIVQYLSLKREEQSVKQIARGCLVAQNVLSSQLNDLFKLNVVSRDRRGRESYYELAEALFRIVYQADLEQEGAPVRLFIDFLGNFYTAQELLRRSRGYALLGEKLGNKEAVPFMDESKFHAQALVRYHPELAPQVSQSVPLGGDLHQFFGELRKAGAYLDIIQFSSYLQRDKDAFVLHTEAYALARLGNREKAIAAADEALDLDSKDIEAHLVLGEALTARDDSRQHGIEHALRAAELAATDAETLERAGRIVGRAGEPARALDCFEGVKILRPEYSNGWRLAGVVLKKLGRLEEAEQHYRKAIELDGKNASAHENLGALLGNAGRHADALAEFEAITKLRPEYSDGWGLAGVAFENLGRLEEAEQHYRKAIELDGKNASAHENLGTLLGNAGRHADALAEFETVARLRPEHSDGWQLAGVVLRKLGRLEEAEQHFRKVIELDGNNASAHGNLGALLGNAGRHADALAEFEAVKRLRPEYSDGWRLVGVAFENLGSLKEAEQHYRKAIELDGKNASAHEDLGTLLGNAGRHADALAEFEAVKRLRPEYSDGWRRAGVVLKKLGRLEEAELHFRKAIELDGKNASAHENLGALQGNAGRHADALAEFEAVKRLRPEYSDGWRRAGLALEEQGRLEEAEQHFRKAIELDGNNADAHVNCGVLLGNAGRHTDALAEFEAVKRLRPEYSDGWRIAGVALEELGRLEEAEQHYRKAIELDGNNADAQVNLGVLLGNAGRDTEALQAFNTALALGADPARLYNSRGEMKRLRDDFEAALRDYHLALAADTSAVWPKFNIISAQLGLGNVAAATGVVGEAFQAANTTGAEASILVQSIHENLLALFEHAPEQGWGTFLKEYLSTLSESRLMPRLEQGLSLTVFALLKAHTRLTEARLIRVIACLQDHFEGLIDVSVAVRFLQTGIEYFLHKEDRVLLRLPKEERQLFMRELGIGQEAEPGI